MSTSTTSRPGDPYRAGRLARQPGVDSPIIGVRTEEHLQQVPPVLDIRLDDIREHFRETFGDGFHDIVYCQESHGSLATPQADPDCRPKKRDEGNLKRRNTVG